MLPVFSCVFVVKMPTPEDTCRTCNEALPPDGRALKCCECEYVYHLGDCSGWSEATFKGKNEAARRSWRCVSCRATKSKGGGRLGSDSDIARTLADIVQKLDALAGLPAQVIEVKQSIELMSQKYDEVVKTQAEHEAEIRGLKQRVGKLECKFAKQDVPSLQAAVNDLEWRSRKQNLEIYGIPPSENENLISKLNDVARTVSLPALSVDDVIDVHRLPSRHERVPGIIVRFSRQSLRDSWFDKRQVLRAAKSTVSIAENPTKYNRELLRYTRDWASENGFRYAWHSNNKVLLRQEQGFPAVVVHSKADLDKMSAE